MQHTWDALRHASAEHGERNDCTVKALAVALCAPYSVAHSTLAARGRITGRGCCEPVWGAAVQDLGGELRNVTQYVRNLGGRTVRSIERVLRQHFHGKRFLIGTRGHLLAFDGAEIVDWSRDGLRRVNRVYLVTGQYDGPELEPTPQPAPAPEHPTHDPAGPVPIPPRRRERPRDIPAVTALESVLNAWHYRHLDT